MNILYGVALNDSDYRVTKIIRGKQVMCPFYKIWRGVIRRCLCKKEKARQKSYGDVTICDEWLRFSSFKAWMEMQDWKGKSLDKDLLVAGSRIYSPETCCFIDQRLNSILNIQRNKKNGLSKGVYFDSDRKKFSAQISINGKSTSLGRFDCEIDAKNAYIKARKEKLTEIAKEYSGEVSRAILRHIEII